MEGREFDNLTRRLATGASRRRVLRSALALAGAGLGLRVTEPADAATKRAFGQICRKNGDCLSDRCLPRDSTGRQRCGCLDVSECPPLTSDDVCQTAACLPDGTCGFAANVGAECNDDDACTINDICGEDGICAGAPLDCTQLDGPCTTGSCTNGKCVPIPTNEGDPCTDDNGRDGTCTQGLCTSGPPIGEPCDDGDPCTINDVIGQDSICRGTPILCPVCQACSGGTCAPAEDGAECEDENGRPGTCESGVCGSAG